MTIRRSLVPAFLFACLILGGASAAGYAANALLQLVAVVIIALSLATRRAAGLSRAGSVLLLLTALLLALFLVQLLPLPPALWSALPGREPVFDGFALLDVEQPWLPLSLAPADTVASFIWLLPAFAVLLGMIRLGAFHPFWIGMAIVAGAALSAFIGALQLAGGVQSSWYLYQITNRGVAVGLFANANHLATLLLATIPFIAAVYARATRRADSSRQAGVALLTVAGLVVVAIGILITGSLAGIGLAVPTAAASFMLIRRPANDRLVRWYVPGIALLAAISVAVVLSGPFNNNLIGESARTSADSRLVSFSRTFDAARDYGPVGSGIGTFVEVYRLYEDPDQVDRFFMNNAHNDYLQILLETGLPGLALLAVVLIWWTRRFFDIWRHAESEIYARAATIASAAILVHSVVDYPLRTAAVSAVLAACFALMAKPRPEQTKTATDEPKGVHLSAD